MNFDEPDKPATPSIFSSLDNVAATALMLASGSVKSQRARNLIMFSGVAFQAGKAIYSRYKENQAENTFVIKIADTDPLYSHVHRWILENMGEHEQKDLKASTRERVYRYAGSNEEEIKREPLVIVYSGDREQSVVIAGHRVTVRIDQAGHKPTGGGAVTVSMNQPSYIIIECLSLEAQRAVISELRKAASKEVVRRPSFRTATKWGDFKNSSTIPVRPIETVVLKEGQAERIIEDLRTFLEREEQYLALGIPYHRGLLLHGDPGTGKTSIASALAHELDLDVYYIALSSVPDDTTLNELLREVGERSVLLLEDVDIAHATTARTDEGGGITLSGLLNALDGFATPYGLITIMTTNRLAVLDDALIRPGRIDLSEEINAVNSYQVEALCKQFLGFVPSGLPTVEVSDNIVAAEVVDVFKHYLDNPEAAGEAVVSMLTEKLSGSVKNATKSRKSRSPRKAQVSGDDVRQ